MSIGINAKHVRAAGMFAQRATGTAIGFAGWATLLCGLAVLAYQAMVAFQVQLLLYFSSKVSAVVNGVRDTWNSLVTYFTGEVPEAATPAVLTADPVAAFSTTTGIELLLIAAAAAVVFAAIAVQGPALRGMLGRSNARHLLSGFSVYAAVGWVSSTASGFSLWLALASVAGLWVGMAVLPTQHNVLSGRNTCRLLVRLGGLAFVGWLVGVHFSGSLLQLIRAGIVSIFDAAVAISTIVVPFLPVPSWVGGIIVLLVLALLAYVVIGQLPRFRIFASILLALLGLGIGISAASLPLLVPFLALFAARAAGVRSAHLRHVEEELITGQAAVQQALDSGHVVRLNDPTIAEAAIQAAIASGRVILVESTSPLAAPATSVAALPPPTQGFVGQG